MQPKYFSDLSLILYKFICQRTTLIEALAVYFPPFQSSSAKGDHSFTTGMTGLWRRSTHDPFVTL